MEHVPGPAVGRVATGKDFPMHQDREDESRARPAQDQDQDRREKERPNVRDRSGRLRPMDDEALNKDQQ